jgi:hypothetical protein
MKTTMTLQKQVLDRIKTQNVRPTPRGYFRARDFLVWGLVGASGAALSIGVGMIIYMAVGADLSLFEKLGFSTSEKIIYSIPYFWILASIAIGVIAYVNFRNTRNGYKVDARQFVIISLLIALAFGSLAYALNLTKYVDIAAAKSIPLYNSVVPLNTNTWYDPSHGLLSGTIKERNSDTDFTLRDSNSVLWHITGENIYLPQGYEMHTGDRIKLIGKDLGGDNFQVVEIRLWE